MNYHDVIYKNIILVILYILYIGDSQVSHDPQFENR